MSNSDREEEANSSIIANGGSFGNINTRRNKNKDKPITSENAFDLWNPAQSQDYSHIEDPSERSEAFREIN